MACCEPNAQGRPANLYAFCLRTVAARLFISAAQQIKHHVVLIHIYSTFLNSVETLITTLEQPMIKKRCYLTDYKMLRGFH